MRGILCITVGEVMRDSSTEFAADPCSLSKRGAMVRAARALLSAVTRLLILADMVDVHLLLKSLRMVCFYTKTFKLMSQTIINLYFISSGRMKLCFDIFYVASKQLLSIYIKKYSC